VRVPRHPAAMTVTQILPETRDQPRRSSATLQAARHLAETTPWRQGAACRGAEHAPFFQNGLRPRSMYERCASCPVRDVCLWVAVAYESDAGFHHGVWGGTVPEVRAGMVARHADLEIADRLVEALDVAGLLRQPGAVPATVATA
jgi:WhiB family redox-sensing transcriptional regulator